MPPPDTRQSFFSSYLLFFSFGDVLYPAMSHAPRPERSSALINIQRIPTPHKIHSGPFVISLIVIFYLRSFITRIISPFPK